MTIEYQNEIVPYPITIRPKGSLLGALFRGLHVSALNLTPDPEDPLNDTVTIISSYGADVVTGPEINYDPRCTQNHIRWTENPSY